MNQSPLSSEAVLAGASLRAAIRDAVGTYLDLEQYHVFLFGSEASGVADPRSDIDVGILGPQPVPGSIVQRIRAELDRLRTLRPFDVIDFASVDESFKADALEHAERL